MYQHGSACKQRKVSDRVDKYTIRSNVLSIAISHSFLYLIIITNRLHQTLAKLKLKEEERKKEVIIEELKVEEEIARRRKKQEESKKEESSTKRHPSPPKASRFIRVS